MSLVTGQTLNFLLVKYQKHRLADLSMKKNTIKKYRVYNLPLEKTRKVDMIKELGCWLDQQEPQHGFVVYY